MKKIKILIFCLMLFYLQSCKYTDFNRVEKMPQETVVLYETEKIEEVIEPTNEVERSIEELIFVFPNYKKVVYSKAYLLQKDIKIVEKAYEELYREINNSYMSEEDKTIASMNYKTIETYLQRDFDTTRKGYEKMDETEYLNYLKEKGNNYKEKMYVVNGAETTTNLSLQIDLNSMEKKAYHYEFDGIFYKPVKIEKKTVLNLEYGDKIMIQYPKFNEDKNIIENKNTMMIYDGGMGFTYNDDKREEVIDADDITDSCYLLPLDDDYYAFYEGENRRVDLVDKDVKIKILKDAKIGIAPSFLSIAREEMKKKNGEEYKIYNYDCYKVFNKYVDGEENEFFEKSKSFFGNYLIFDEKGYVVDFYYFGEGE